MAMPPMQGMPWFSPMPAMPGMPPMFMAPMAPMFPMDMAPRNGERAMGVSTAVCNGIVYVNNTEVYRLPPGSPVNVQSINSDVYVNDVLVWSQGATVPHGGAPVGAGVHHGGAPVGAGVYAVGAGGLDNGHILGNAIPAPAADDGNAANIRAAAAVAMANSRADVCNADFEDPCAVCIGDIRSGCHTRTLPCFHVLHRHCAEAYFNQPGSIPVLCPTCRTPIGANAHDGDAAAHLLEAIVIDDDV